VGSLGASSAQQWSGPAGQGGSVGRAGGLVAIRAQLREGLLQAADARLPCL
jgi:hypothetical protein